MPNPTDAPYIEDALIAWLDRAFPALQVSPTTVINEVMWDSGKREVIQRLKQLHKTQREQQSKPPSP